MRSRPLVIIFSLVVPLLLTPATEAVDLLFRDVTLGRVCTFKIPRLWKQTSRDWQLPPEVVEQIVTSEFLQFEGKETVTSANFVMYATTASIEGAVQESITQMAAQPDVESFEHMCIDGQVRFANSTICTMTWLRSGNRLYSKNLIFVPISDVRSLYSISVFYIGNYNEKVADKLFSSIGLQ